MLDALKETEHHQRLFLFVNDMKYEHNLAYYPFPLCFRSPDALFRFYNGELLIYVVIDMERVNEILVSHGLSARLSDRDRFSWKIVSPADEGGSWYISSHMVGRLNPPYGCLFEGRPVSFRECGVSCSGLPMYKPHSIPDDEVNVSQIHLITSFVEAKCAANWQAGPRSRNSFISTFDMLKVMGDNIH